MIHYVFLFTLTKSRNEVLHYFPMDYFLKDAGEYLVSAQRRRGWVGKGARAPLTSEIQEIFRNFKTLYQLRMCVMTSWDLNVYIRWKNSKLCPPLSPYPRRPCVSCCCGVQNMLWGTFQSFSSHIDYQDLDWGEGKGA